MKLETMEPIWVADKNGRLVMYTECNDKHFVFDASSEHFVRVRDRNGAKWTRVYGGNIRYVLEDEPPAEQAGEDGEKTLYQPGKKR